MNKQDPMKKVNKHKQTKPWISDQILKKIKHHPWQMEGQNHDIKFRLDLGVCITKYTRSLRQRTKWDAIINKVFNQSLKQIFYIYTNNCRQSF